MSAKMNIYGLTKSFNGKLVLDNVQMELKPGRIAGLMGPNGAGKTTMLKTIMQIYKADAGNVIVNGIPINFKAKGQIAYMPDCNHLYKWMHVKDALHYYQDVFADFDSEKAYQLCELLHIKPGAMVATLPRGTIQLVLIILTFSRKAGIYLLDEPIGGIDPLARQRILHVILSNIQEDSTVLLATHLVNEVETILDDVFFLNEGCVLVADSAENIRAQRNQSIMEYYLEVFENAQAA
jgi:ABC-2 type transport system ATP-binding protein